MNSNDSLCFLALSLTIEQRPVRTDSPSSFFGLQAQRVVSDCRTRNGLCADTGDTTSRHEQQRVTAQSCALISATQQVCTSRSAPLNLARAEHPRPDSVSKGLSKSVDGGAYPNGWRLALGPRRWHLRPALGPAAEWADFGVRQVCRVSARPMRRPHVACPLQRRNRRPPTGRT